MAKRKVDKPRLGVIITDDVYAALVQESERTGSPIAQLVRLAVEMLLVSRGYKVDSTIVWGGPRAQKDVNPGQLLEVSAGK